jgi:hypothetical protein
MLGELAFLHLDLATAADAAPAAYALDIDAELAGGFKNGRALGKASALSRGHE